MLLPAIHCPASPVGLAITAIQCLNLLSFANEQKSPAGYSKFADQKVSTIPSRTGMLIIYVPAMVTAGAMLATAPHVNGREALVAGLTLVHFAKRVAEVIFVHKCACAPAAPALSHSHAHAHAHTDPHRLHAHLLQVLRQHGADVLRDWDLLRAAHAPDHGLQQAKHQTPLSRSGPCGLSQLQRPTRLLGDTALTLPKIADSTAVCACRCRHRTCQLAFMRPRHRRNPV